MQPSGLAACTRSLVRRLNDITSTLAAPSVWMYLAVLLGEKTLLPSVQELHWTIKSSTSVELVLLVSPSLQMLFLSLEDFEHGQEHWIAGLNTLLCNIVPHMPYLSQLQVLKLETPDISRIVSPLSSLARLTHCICVPMLSPTWRRYGPFPG